MDTLTRFATPALLALAAAASAPARASESYDNCTGFVDALPAVIETQGTWCLRHDLATAIASGDAILIKANNVTLDCNHFKLGGLSAGNATTTIGVHLHTRLNATVRNCTIRGFHRGVYFEGVDGGGHLIEHNRFDGNTHVAVHVVGEGNLVRENLVVDTGGSAVNGEAFGIRAEGPTDLVGNSISGVAGSGLGNFNAFGIWSTGNDGGRIIGNGVRGIYPGPGGFAGGIFLSGFDSITILRGNDVSSDVVEDGIGIRCVASDSRIKDNIVANFALPWVNCGDGGGNDFVMPPP